MSNPALPPEDVTISAAVGEAYMIAWASQLANSPKPKDPTPYLRAALGMESHARMAAELADCRALLRDCRSLLDELADMDNYNGHNYGKHDLFLRQIHAMQQRIDKQVK